MPKSPPPCDEAFLLADGKPVPVTSIPPEEWAERRRDMMENVGKIVSADLARGE